MRAGLREKNDVVIIDLVGEMRLSEEFTPSLQKMITEQLSSGKKKILLNFAKVDFIDSYGIGDIVSAYIAVQEKKGKLKFVHLSDKIWLIFNYSGLTKIFEIFDSEEKALKTFA
jgi:anti-sigma B factor antagonist